MKIREIVKPLPKIRITDTGTKDVFDTEGFLKIQGRGIYIVVKPVFGQSYASPIPGCEIGKRYAIQDNPSLSLKNLIEMEIKMSEVELTHWRESLVG